MIKGLSADNARPLPQTTAKRKTEKQDGFADQLMGAESDRPENLNRNERHISGRGRDSSAKERAPSNREESRSNDHEKDSNVSGLNRKMTDRRREKRDDGEVRESNAGDRSYGANAPTYNHASVSAPKPPVIENSPNTSEEAPIEVGPSTEKELKLPDFFSKASLEKGAAKTAKAGGKEAVQAADVLAQMKANESVSREEAMSHFVDRMDQMGISSEKLLEAFSQLDDKAMAAPPEESMGQFLHALELSPQDEDKAGVLYKDLIKTTGDSLINERVAGMDDGVNFDVMSPRDASLRKLNSSLEDLNKSFFRKDAATPKKAHEDMQSMDLALAKFVHDRNAAAGIEAQPVAVEAQVLAQAEPAFDAEPAQVEENAGLAAALANVLNQQPEAELGEGADSFATKLAAASSKTPSKASLESAFASEIAADDSEIDELDVDAEAAAPKAKLDPSQMLAQDAPAQPMAASRSAAVMGPADMMMNRQASAQDEQDNVKELIKQAQIMVKRGGGEMKMEMKPEGMGQIHLRVNVENGNVNVQMLTESESAKHLLEKGLSELKTNLAAHELKVQSLKVDVGNDIRNQMDQQATQDQARQHARQMASDFMSDFRDGNQGFRQGFMENRGWRSYQHNKGPETLQPEQVARATATARGDNSKRLNLVA